MTFKLIYRLLISVLVILSMSNIAGCSAPIPVLTPTVIATNTIAPAKTSVPSATITSTPELSPTATLVPTISLPTKVISSQNIGQVKELGSRELAGKPDEVFPRSMDFTPDGHMVVAAYDTSIYVWDGLTGQPIISMDHSSYLWKVAISPDGRLIASGDDYGVIKVWDVKTGERIYSFAHHGTIWSLAFSSDNTLLASGSLAQTVRIWGLADGKEVDHLTKINVESVAFSPDGKLLAIGTDDKIILWEIDSKQPIRTLHFNLRGGEGLSGIQGVLFSPDGKMIAAADADNIAMVWDISSGKKLSTIVGKGTIIRMSEGTLAFSPDSKMIATGNDNDDVIFWDVLADKELWRITSKSCNLMDVIFGSNNSVFEVGCWNGTLQFWGIP